jgi:hypothetical protein
MTKFVDGHKDANGKNECGDSDDEIQGRCPGISCGGVTLRRVYSAALRLSR